MQTGVPGGDGATTMKMETAFDQLVLPEGHKRMLLSLIAQHFRDKEATTRRQAIDDDEVDIVRGKGMEARLGVQHFTAPTQQIGFA